MIYMGVFVVAYVLGWFVGFNNCVTRVEKQLKRIELARQAQSIKNLYPDQ